MLDALVRLWTAFDNPNNLFEQAYSVHRVPQRGKEKQICPIPPTFAHSNDEQIQKSTTTPKGKTTIHFKRRLEFIIPVK